MTCTQCGAPCQGGLCQQCEIESANEHLADELARDEPNGTVRNSERLEAAKQSLTTAINRSCDAEADAAARAVFEAELTLRRRDVGRPDLARRLETTLTGDVTTTEARQELRQVAQKIDAELTPDVSTASFVTASTDGGERR